MTQCTSFDLVEFGQPLQETLRELPEPTGTEILLQIKRVGVCHSDLHIIEGMFDLGEEGQMRMADRGMRLPRTLGHEIVGTVIAAGPEAKHISLGQTALVFPWLGCGTCRACIEGRENDCMQMRIIGLVQNGGYATHVFVESPEFLIDVNDMDLDTIAPHACSGLTVYNALGKLNKPHPEAWLAILGAGGLGLNAIAIAQALGFKNIVAVDVDDKKLAAARNLGATAVLNSKQGESIDKLRQITDNALTDVLDTVGAPATAKLAVHALIKAGRYVVVGLHGGDFKMPQPWLPQKAMTVAGSHVGTCQQLHDLIDLVRAGKVKKIPVTLRPLSEINQALNDLHEGKVTGRIILTND